MGEWPTMCSTKQELLPHSPIPGSAPWTFLSPASHCSIPGPAAPMPQSNLPAKSIKAGAEQKHINAFWYLSVLSMQSCKFMSIWLYFTPHNSPPAQSSLPDVRYLPLQPHRLWQVKSNRNLLGARAAPTHSTGHRSPNRLTTFVTRLEIISGMSWCCCPASGPGMQNYGPNIWKTSKVGTAAEIQDTNPVREDPRAAKAVFIHSHIQISQDKVKLVPKQYQSIYALSNSCGHLSNTELLTVLHTLPSPNLALKLPSCWVFSCLWGTFS